MGCGYEDGKSVRALSQLVSDMAENKHEAIKSQRDAEKALDYLEQSDVESLKIMRGAIAGLKENYSGDLSALKTMDDKSYMDAVAKLEAPASKAEKDLDAIQQAIRRMPFFAADPADLKPMDVKTESGPYGPMVVGGPTPLLWNTGFRSKEVTRLLGELQKAKSDFWNTGPGKDIYAARSMRGAQQQRERDETPSGEEAKLLSAFYDGFAKAYASRDDAAVMSYISNDWQATDGTSLSDVQDNLRRTFRTFDEISYSISNLRIKKLLPYHYQADYDLTIASRIYKRNLRHEEKSSVSEEVGADNSGKLKIERTLNGRFWYVK